MTTLRCRCGIEVGIVRLNADTLALGHRVNPRNNRHPVRLARSAAVQGNQPLSEGPNVGREDGSSDGPSHLIATGTRPARKGSTRSRSAPSGISSRRRLPEHRMWARVDRSDPTACWEWPGARNAKGYGLLFDKVTGVHWRTHRLAWTAENGPIPDGQMVLHTCDNPPCVNPAHLRLGTNSDNVRDMVAKDRHPSHMRPSARPGSQRRRGASPPATAPLAPRSA